MNKALLLPRYPLYIPLLLLVVSLAAAAHAAPQPVACWAATNATATEVPNITQDALHGSLHGVTLMNKKEDLVEQPYFAFDGNGGHIEIPFAPPLNAPQFTLLAWLKVEPCTIEAQVPVALKSLPAHEDPYYQYGLFLCDLPEHPAAIAFHISAAGRMRVLEAPNALLYSEWMAIAATYDGATLRILRNGQELARLEGSPAAVDDAVTPLLIGAYANLPRQRPNTLTGAVASLRFYANALGAEELRALYESERPLFPAASKETEEASLSDYDKGLNAALRNPRDVWGEELIANGGATYDNIKEYLRPLFYSTGDTNETYGAHNLLLAEDGGDPPYIIPLADGSRIAAGIYNSPDYAACTLGDAGEPFGSVLERLAFPTLDGGYYPILHVGYTDAAGNRFSQEIFPGRIPGLAHIAAFVTLSLESANPASAAYTFGQPDAQRVAADAPLNAGRLTFDFSKPASARFIWSPQDPLPVGIAPSETLFNDARKACKQYWDQRLARGILFQVPEPLVMDVQRNHLIQNLIMRWRYSLGAVVYHGSFFQPESSDTASCLAMYGHLDACRDALAHLIDQTKGEAYYSNWERGEKLSHGAHYYFLTRDDEFLARLTPKYDAICDNLRSQIETDPRSLLHKQRHCGDIATKAYCTFHQTVCWRGLRDMAEAWQLAGNHELHARYQPLAETFRRNLKAAADAAAVTLPDGSLFIPSMLDEPEGRTVYDPITQTRIGSYWNLCMPYAFSSGLWPPSETQLPRILDFIHNHGGILLGLLRFNYYPVPIGACRQNGLPGYATTGFDNVYLPGYIRVLADLDEAERLVLTFYGKLAHGQTRGTFVSGEGENVASCPERHYRACYGTPCSANNTAFLLALRLMLLRESFDAASGLPDSLFLLHATPRQWLADGNTIQFQNAPTCFGPVSCNVTSQLQEGRITARIDVPQRNRPNRILLKLRLPDGARIKAVRVDGVPSENFDSQAETIEISQKSATVVLDVACQ